MTYPVLPHQTSQIHWSSLWSFKWMFYWSHCPAQRKLCTHVPIHYILSHVTSLYNDITLLKQYDNLTTTLKTSSSTRLSHSSVKTKNWRFFVHTKMFKLAGLALNIGTGDEWLRCVTVGVKSSLFFKQNYQSFSWDHWNRAAV